MCSYAAEGGHLETLEWLVDTLEAEHGPSASALEPYLNERTAYCAAKGGILALTRSLAREVVTRGIRVNAIAPGWVETDLTDFLEEASALIAAQTPMGRLGEPDDIAWAAVYLASDEAKFVTGQVLSPNGGWYMSQ